MSADGWCLEVLTISSFMISQAMLSCLAEIFVSLTYIKIEYAVKSPTPKFIRVIAIFLPIKSSFIKCRHTRIILRLALPIQIDWSQMPKFGLFVLQSFIDIRVINLGHGFNDVDILPPTFPPSN